MNLPDVKSFVPSVGFVARVAVALVILATVLPLIPVIGPRIRAGMNAGVAGLISPNKSA